MERHVCIYRSYYKIRDTRVRGVVQAATCRRMRERDSKHPCDQFAQDDIEMREAVLE